MSARRKIDREPRSAAELDAATTAEAMRRHAPTALGVWRRAVRGEGATLLDAASAQQETIS
jgi:hypothetical protein